MGNTESGGDGKENNSSHWQVLRLTMAELKYDLNLAEIDGETDEDFAEFIRYMLGGEVFGGSVEAGGQIKWKSGTLQGYNANNDDPKATTDADSTIFDLNDKL